MNLLSRVGPLVFMVFSLGAGAQVNSYVPDTNNNRFVPPGATPDVKSWAPYDTSVRPQANTNPNPGYVNSIIPDQVGGASPIPMINPPIPYQFAPINPSGTFLLR
jgi:hypothetical protein